MSTNEQTVTHLSMTLEWCLYLEKRCFVKKGIGTAVKLLIWISGRMNHIELQDRFYYVTE